MKLNTFPFHSMQEYMERFSPFNETFEDHHISDVYRLIERRREGGVGLIEYVCSMLTNDGVKRGCAFMDRFVQWADEENKDYGTQYLAVLYLNVYGKEIQREERYSPFILTGKRVKQVWINEGKDEEGEWERRWREAGDIMNEEDVMETSIMHLCIPDYERKNSNQWIVPSVCSSTALSILLLTNPNKHCPYHFPIYDRNTLTSHVAVIRNLPSSFDIRSSRGIELKQMVSSIYTTYTLHQPYRENYGIATDCRYSVAGVKVDSVRDGLRIVKRLNGCEFHGQHLSVSVIMKVDKEVKKEEEEIAELLMEERKRREEVERLNRALQESLKYVKCELEKERMWREKNEKERR